MFGISVNNRYLKKPGYNPFNMLIKLPNHGPPAVCSAGNASIGVNAAKGKNALTRIAHLFVSRLYQGSFLNSVLNTPVTILCFILSKPFFLLNN